MGNFYTNITLKGASRERVEMELQSRTAIVSKMTNGCVVVFDEECDSAGGTFSGGAISENRSQDNILHFPSKTGLASEGFVSIHLRRAVARLGLPGVGPSGRLSH